MATSVTISATLDDGTPAEKLSELIALRERYMGGLSEDAVTATTLNVVTSLKGLTRSAPVKSVPPGSYTISESPNLFPGFYTLPDTSTHKVCLRTLPNNRGHRSHIRPVMLISPSERNAMSAKVYVISTANPNDKFEKNANRPDRCWYVLAPSRDSAVAFAERQVLRMLRKESGMAKFSLAKAQAKIYNRAGGAAVQPVTGAKQWQIAANATIVTKSGSGFSSGSFGIEVNDTLRYSALALRGGSAALSTAMEKAANRTAAIINHHLSAHGITETRIPTPFPEIAR